MTITKMKIKLFGKIGAIYRVIDKDGEIVAVFETLEEATAYVG